MTKKKQTDKVGELQVLYENSSTLYYIYLGESGIEHYKNKYYCLKVKDGEITEDVDGWTEKPNTYF